MTSILGTIGRIRIIHLTGLRRGVSGAEWGLTGHRTFQRRVLTPKRLQLYLAEGRQVSGLRTRSRIVRKLGH